MADIVNELFMWFGIEGIGEMSTVSDLFDVTIRLAVGCGFTVFIFKQVFKLVTGYIDFGG